MTQKRGGGRPTIGRCELQSRLRACARVGRARVLLNEKADSLTGDGWGS